MLDQRRLTLEKDVSKIRYEEPTSDKAQIRKLKEDLESIAILNSRYLKDIKELQRTIDYLNAGYDGIHSYDHSISPSFAQVSNLKNKENELDSFKNSYAFRISDILMNAVVKPGKNTIMMPFRIMKLMLNYVLNRKTV
jgi:hypothetical protein